MTTISLTTKDPSCVSPSLDLAIRDVVFSLDTTSTNNKVKVELSYSTLPLHDPVKDTYRLKESKNERKRLI